MGAGASTVANDIANEGVENAEKLVASALSAIPADVADFDVEQAKEVISQAFNLSGEAFDVDKFEAIAGTGGTITKQVMEEAVTDFSALCSIPKDISSFSVDEAKAIVGTAFNQEAFASLAEAGGVSRDVLAGMVGDFAGVDVESMMKTLNINDEQLQQVAKVAGEGLKVVKEVAGPEAVKAVEVAGKEAMKVVKGLSKIPIPAIGTCLAIMSAISMAIEQAQRNQGNARAAWGRLRVIKMVLLSIESDINENAEGFASSAGNALTAMKESSGRVALLLAQIKELIESYCLEPPEEQKVNPSWIPAWDAIKGAAKYVQDTIVQMVTAEAFAEAFEEHMTNLSAEMDALSLAISSKVSHNVNELLKKANQAPMIPQPIIEVKRNDKMMEKVATSLEEMREKMKEMHGEVMGKLDEISQKLDDVFEKLSAKVDTLQAGQEKVLKSVSGIQGDLQQLFALLDKRDKADEFEAKVVNKDFARYTINYDGLEVDREEDELFANKNGTTYEGSYEYQEVAVRMKEISSKVPTEEWKSIKDLFMREICLCCNKAMRHTNLIRTMGGFIRETPRRELITVFELLENGTVRDYIEEKGAVTLDVAIGMLEDASRGLAHLHEKNICHRNLRASSLYVTFKSGKIIVQLGEFSRAPRSSSDEPNWLAPELLKKNGEDTYGAAEKETDVYAFGCTTYELLSDGKIPWAGVDAGAVVEMVLKGERPVIDKKKPGSEGIIGVMEDCMAEEAEYRPVMEELVPQLSELRKKALKVVAKADSAEHEVVAKIKAKKKAAIEAEDFVAAKEAKEALKKAEEILENIATATAEKAKAIAEEYYGDAKAAKDRIKSLEAELATLAE